MNTNKALNAYKLAFFREENTLLEPTVCVGLAEKDLDDMFFTNQFFCGLNIIKWSLCSDARQEKITHFCKLVSLVTLVSRGMKC